MRRKYNLDKCASNRSITCMYTRTGQDARAYMRARMIDRVQMHQLIRSCARTIRHIMYVLEKDRWADGPWKLLPRFDLAHKSRKHGLVHGK